MEGISFPVAQPQHTPGHSLGPEELLWFLTQAQTLPRLFCKHTLRFPCDQLEVDKTTMD